MTSPNFKVLVNALQLGQPPDLASIRAVVEQLFVQQEEIAELRRQVAMLNNRVAAFSFAAEPEMGGIQSRAPQVPETGPMATAPQDPAQQASHYELQPGYAEAGYAEAGYAEAGYAETPASSPYPDAPRSDPQGARPPVSAADPGQLLTGQLRTDQLPTGKRIRRDDRGGSARNVPSVIADFESDFGEGTQVIGKEEASRLLEDAPFPIAPAGAAHRPVSEIPGAPWAREPGKQVTGSRASESSPNIYDTYTIDGTEPRAPQAAPPPPPAEASEAPAPPRVETDFEDDSTSLHRRHRRRDRS